MAINLSSLMNQLGQKGSQFAQGAMGAGQDMMGKAQQYGQQGMDMGQQGMNMLERGAGQAYGGFSGAESNINDFLRQQQGAISPNEYSRLMMLQPEKEDSMMGGQLYRTHRQRPPRRSDGRPQQQGGFMDAMGGAMGNMFSDPELYKTLGALGLSAYETGGDLGQMSQDATSGEQLLRFFQSQAGRGGYGNVAQGLGTASQAMGMVADRQNPARALGFRHGARSLPALTAMYLQQQQQQNNRGDNQDESAPQEEAMSQPEIVPQVEKAIRRQGKSRPTPQQRKSKSQVKKALKKQGKARPTPLQRRRKKELEEALKKQGKARRR